MKSWFVCLLEFPLSLLDLPRHPFPISELGTTELQWVPPCTHECLQIVLCSSTSCPPSYVLAWFHGILLWYATVNMAGVVIILEAPPLGSYCYIPYCYIEWFCLCVRNGSAAMCPLYIQYGAWCFWTVLIYIDVAPKMQRCFSLPGTCVYCVGRGVRRWESMHWCYRFTGGQWAMEKHLHVISTMQSVLLSSVHCTVYR